MLPGDPLLVMVGRDVDEKKIESDRVRQLGLLSDDELAAAYEACDVFVLPSMFESFGMVFLDAWLRGKPVIGNATCGAAAFLIEDGTDGLLCRNAREMASAAHRLLDDPELAARMGAAGRAKVLANYTWERVADRALDAIQELLAGVQPPKMTTRESLPSESGRDTEPPGHVAVTPASGLKLNSRL
jgi:glycosyltransferase involved in cell wall biosynthesis